MRGNEYQSRVSSTHYDDDDEYLQQPARVNVIMPRMQVKKLKGYDYSSAEPNGRRRLAILFRGR